MFGAVQRGEEKAPGRPQSSLPVLKWGLQEGLFTSTWNKRTRGGGYKLKEGRFRPDIGRKFFTLRVLGHWNRLPSEVRLDEILNNLVQWRVSFPMSGVWNWTVLKVSSKPNHVSMMFPDSVLDLPSIHAFHFHVHYIITWKREFFVKIICEFDLRHYQKKKKKSPVLQHDAASACVLSDSHGLNAFSYFLSRRRSLSLPLSSWVPVPAAGGAPGFPEPGSAGPAGSGDAVLPHGGKESPNAQLYKASTVTRAFPLLPKPRVNVAP